MYSDLVNIFGSGLQPTYEELKLYWNRRFDDHLERLQPTYEELKRTTGLSAGWRQPGLQPTYEELKQRLRVEKPEIFAEVCSLPMRN